MLRSFLFALLLAVMGVGLLFPGTSLAGKPHPRIHNALYELREVRSELQAAKHTFGGHRKAALRDVKSAIEQLTKALKFSGDKRPFKGTPKAEVHRKGVTYPHIRHAVVELRETAAELKVASHDYGGHRKKALVDIEATIRQLELCIKFANSKK